MLIFLDLFAYMKLFSYLCTRKGYGRTIIMDSMVLKEPARLYDPETGEYLNDETMRVIEDARQGKNIAFKGSFDEFKSWAEAL